MTDPAATRTTATEGPATATEQPATDLTTRYLGLTLAHPIVASSSPLTGEIETLLQLEQAGAAAVVLPSLFEEQIEHESLTLDACFEMGVGFNPETHGGYFPELDDYNTGHDDYLQLLADAKRELSIPVIASLNGNSDGGWASYATTLQEAGADALELNIYLVAANPDQSGTEVEDQYLRLVEHVRSVVEIPLAVKVGPQFSSPANMARRLAAAGADGLVLFNRFYQPDIDLETLDVAPDLVLSNPIEMRLILRWIAIMAGNVDADLAATTGVHDAAEVIKLILAGADVTMMTSALLRHGPDHLTTVLDGVRHWFTERDYASTDQARGSVSQNSVSRSRASRTAARWGLPDPTAFERANYMKTLVSYATQGPSNP